MLSSFWCSWTEPFLAKLEVLYARCGGPVACLSAHGVHEQARSRQCAQPGCGKRPVFNHPGEKLPILCQAHKVEGMVDVLNRLCTHPGKHHPSIRVLKVLQMQSCYLAVYNTPSA